MVETPSRENVSEGIIKQLKRTRPWVFVFSLLGFLFVASSLFSTVALFLTEQGLLDPELGFGSDSPDFGFLVDSGYQAYISITLGLIGVVLYFLIAYYLFKYSREISKLIKTRSILDLENTIAAQSSFWKTLGIVTIINLTLLLLALGLPLIISTLLNVT